MDVMGKRSATRRSHRKPGISPWIKCAALASILVVALTVAYLRSDSTPTVPAASTATSSTTETPTRKPVIITAPAEDNDPAVIDPYAKDQITASEIPSADTPVPAPSPTLAKPPATRTAPATSPSAPSAVTEVKRISASHIDVPVSTTTTPPPTTPPPAPATETVIVEAAPQEEEVVKSAAPKAPIDAGRKCVAPKGNYDGVTPYVGIIGAHIQQKFNVITVAGKGGRPTKDSEHPKGLALDFMTNTGNVDGDAIRDYMLEHAADFNVKYVIWQQTLYLPGRAPRAMEDRGSDTANHRDHVHVSFKDTPGPVTPSC